MPMLRPPYLHLDPVDARIYMAVRDDGPVERSALMARFPEDGLSAALQRIDRLVEAGLLTERRIGQKRLIEIANQPRRLNQWWTDLRQKLRSEQPEP